MWRGVAKTIAATAAFGAVHSVLASRAAKNAFARVAGDRNRDGLYRAFFNAQSLVTFGALAVYVARQPNETIYDVRGPARALMRGGQATSFALAVAAAYRVGMTRILGLRSLDQWRTAGAVEAEPEAQGPSPDADGNLHAEGPFRYTRHPLNLSPLPAFWLTPRMTANRLAFNIIGTAYLILGSLHEEYRLRQAYGDRYEAYQNSGTPFYFPTRANPRTAALPGVSKKRLN